MAGDYVNKSFSWKIYLAVDNVYPCILKLTHTIILFHVEEEPLQMLCFVTHKLKLIFYSNLEIFSANLKKINLDSFVDNMKQ